MKAKHLEVGDVVFFRNGTYAIVQYKNRPDNDFFKVHVIFDCLSTTYYASDELLVARNGQVL